MPADVWKIIATQVSSPAAVNLSSVLICGPLNWRMGDTGRAPDQVTRLNSIHLPPAT